MLSHLTSAATAARDLTRLLRTAARIATPRRVPSHVRLVVPGLQDRVEVLRDRWGVPHVYAGNREDLFRAQGYLHATDRLWQMEMQRRLGAGRLAELVGAAALDSDRFVRTVGLPRSARAEAAALAPDVATAIGCYVEGVNSVITAGDLPEEYGLLGHRPEPWTALDVLVWGKAMALAMGGNWAAELLRARMVEALGAGAARVDIEVPAEQYVTAVPTGWPRASATGPLLDQSHTGTGSNAWVAGPGRTTHGAPLLANDPHLKVSLPAPWYENHLHCPDLHVTGASLPGAPGILIGHNERIAWGITNAKVDVQDLFVEKITDGSYLDGDSWRPVEVRTEEIRIRGRALPHIERVRSTRHGPLVTEVLGDARPGAAELAFSWVGTAPGEVVSSVLAIGEAADWPRFRAALTTWTAPAQVFVYADVEGTIGAVLAGSVPLRRGGDGSVPAPGWTGEHDWVGVIAPDQLPYARNPAQGYVVAANNRIADEDYPHPLPGEWSADYRARRVAELMEDTMRHDVASFAAMQSDVVSLPGLEIAALAPRLPADSPQQSAARTALAQWDGQLTQDSTAGAIYSVLRPALLAHAHADLAEALAMTAGLGLFTWQPGAEFLDYIALPGVLRRAAARDDDWLPGGLTWDDVLAQAWTTALDELTERLGPDVARWRYGDLHAFALRHALGDLPLLGRWMNRGPFPRGGDADTVCAGHLTVRADGSSSFDTASYRVICDLGDWDRSVSVLPTGQSGRPGTPHYADQTELWLRGEYHPLLWSRSRVEEELRQRVDLEASQ